MKRPNGCTWLDMEDDIACTLDQLPLGRAVMVQRRGSKLIWRSHDAQVGKVVVVGFTHGQSHDTRRHRGQSVASPYHEFWSVDGNTIYMPCFFWNSRSSFHRVLTPSIMTWTSWTSEYPSLCLLEMS